MMDFTFSENQLLFHDAVRDFLINEISCDTTRQLWETPSGRSQTIWQQLAKLGLCGLTVPSAYGGLGMNEMDFVLLAQECGYVALSEPLVNTVLVGVPLLNALDNTELKEQWLPKIAQGQAVLAVGLHENICVEDAHIADLLLLQHHDQIHALTADQVILTHNESVDPSRRLYHIDWTPSCETCVALGNNGNTLIEIALNRGALGCAAQALGLTHRMLDLSVQYTRERYQFGKPVGSFQAVKHHLANVAVRWEYAKAPVYRAAFAIARQQANANLNISHAKLAACEAANLAAKNALQVHGAMGYTWDMDLHLFMKKAWALNSSWGDTGFHKARVANSIFADDAHIGVGNTF